jgi:PAS domain S-box-containing protein
MEPRNLEDVRILCEFMDCVDALVFVLDARLRIIEANRNVVIFFGYPAVDLLDKDLTSFIAEDEHVRMTECVQNFIRHGEGEAIFLTRSRNKIRVQFSLSPIHASRACPQGYLLVGHKVNAISLPPISDSSNGLAIRMLRGFTAPVFIIDGSSRTVFNCNEAALATFGFSREELYGKRLLSRAISAEERQRIQAIEERADRTYATAGIFQERILFPRKDLPPLSCDITGLPFFRPDGSLDLIIVMLFDRSAEEEREAELASLIGQISAHATQLTDTASDFMTRKPAPRLSTLGFTTRQIEIARQCASGSSSKEIGVRLGIAESTVKNHLAVMYKKLGVNSRVGFIRALSFKRIKLE